MRFCWSKRVRSCLVPDELTKDDRNRRPSVTPQTVFVVPRVTYVVVGLLPSVLHFHFRPWLKPCTIDTPSPDLHRYSVGVPWDLHEPSLNRRVTLRRNSPYPLSVTLGSIRVLNLDSLIHTNKFVKNDKFVTNDYCHSFLKDPYRVTKSWKPRVVLVDSLNKFHVYRGFTLEILTSVEITYKTFLRSRLLLRVILNSWRHVSLCFCSRLHLQAPP